MAENRPVEFLQQLKTSMQNNGEEFSEVRTWFQKTGLTAEKAAEKCLEKMVDILYQYLSEGILQLTVEEIAKQKECTDAKEQGKKKARIAELKATLPSLSTYLEFVINVGSFEVARIHYDFEAEPEVAVKNAKIQFDGNNVKKITFGSGTATLTLYFIRGDHKIKLHEIEEKLRLPRSIQF